MSPAQNTGSYSGSSGSSEAKQRIVSIVQDRGRTDTVISPLWFIFPVLAVIALFAAYAVVTLSFNSTTNSYSFGIGVLIAIVALILAADIIIAYINYHLVKRQNMHIQREAALRRAMIDYFRTKNQERGGSPAEQYIQAMENIDRDSLSSEKIREPLLYAIIIFIPIIGELFLLYLLWFTSRFASAHDRRWNAFAQNASYAGAQLGENIMPPNPQRIPKRLTILYLIFSIIFPVILILWYYVAIKDLNDHFREEWQFEDQLVGAI